MSSLRSAPRRASRSTALVVLVLLLAGCDGAADHVVEPGVLEFHNDPAKIDVPATVGRGEPFAIRMVTYGGGCIAREATEVDLREDGAEVTPLDRKTIPEENEGCILILLHLVHEVSMSFESPGLKTIRIHGRRVDSRIDEVIEISRLVTVE